ncbi:MAG TPA: hypothetical protein VLZ12_11465 [Verrucomicrobiae bacterium]|nr:hypothetical protein [Verrucomicrobiae bacterium]
MRAVNDAYCHLRKAKRALYRKLMALELGEIESAHLTNRFVWGKFPDARGRLLAHLPDASPLLDQIDDRRRGYESARMMCLAQLRKA